MSQASLARTLLSWPTGSMRHTLERLMWCSLLKRVNRCASWWSNLPTGPVTLRAHSISASLPTSASTMTQRWRRHSRLVMELWPRKILHRLSPQTWRRITLTRQRQLRLKISGPACMRRLLTTQTRCLTRQKLMRICLSSPARQKRHKRKARKVSWWRLLIS